MSDDLFASSPMGGSQAPFKEMQPDTQPATSQPSDQSAAQASQPTQQTAQPTQATPKANNKKLIIIGGSIFAGIIVLLLIVILIILATRNQQVIQVIKETPAPSATPTPDNSGFSQDLNNQINQLSEDINNTDLKQLEMSFPRLNWKIEY